MLLSVFRYRYGLSVISYWGKLKWACTRTGEEQGARSSERGARSKEEGAGRKQLRDDETTRPLVRCLSTASAFTYHLILWPPISDLWFQRQLGSAWVWTVFLL